MNRFLCILLAAAALCAPLSHAAHDKHAWRERGKDLISAVVSAKEARDAKKQEAAAEAGKDSARNWGDRGKDLIDAVIAVQDAKENLTGESVVQSALKQWMLGIVNEYKDHLKDEGRVYARELGDTIVERIREDPKISSSITLVQILCWVVIAYLTIVTIFMVVAVRRMRRDYAHILSLLEKNNGNGAS